jgi:ATP-dependent Lon protease
MSDEERIQILPVLPVRNSVIFPLLLMPMSAGRAISVNAIQAAAVSEQKEIFIIAQRNNKVDFPKQEDFYPIGTKAIIKKLGKGKQDSMSLAVQGVERGVLIRLEQTEPFVTAKVRLIPVPSEKNTEVEALHRAVMELAQRAFTLAQPEGFDLSQLFMHPDNPMQLVYLLGSILNLQVEQEQALLEANTVPDALRLVHAYLSHEVQVLELRNKIAKEAQTEMSKEQREYLLRQQLRAIQQELGESNPEESEAQLLEERLREADLPEDVRKEAERELSRMRKLNPAAPDYHVIRSYLELLLELPWKKATEDVIEIEKARTVLDEDHYDLRDIKERILEHLGVLKLNPEAKAPILCLVGPPGVGKTSLGQSIARALGRKFERMSLGGMHDEAELRGHRRTYVGALPGSIIRVVRRAGVNNPVLMLDEIDKLGRDFRGDPAAALLEILDPEQNKTFRDNYLDLPFDLSHVFFITTANTLDTIPQPLLDRMEVLRLSGYSEEEKILIAQRYLIPRQITQAGINPEQFQISEASLRKLISGYTREAGVRQLERTIGRIVRKIALTIAEGKTEIPAITAETIGEFLGPERFFQEQARKELPPGVATGLAWTEAGGDVLYIEATLLPEGSRTLTLTGQLGEVMQESAKAAHSFLWSHADQFDVDKTLFQKAGVHIHVPAGAIPKDGPSAGVTMATALASLYSGLRTDNFTAMTGEITLTGLVLPVGGIKEKVLAARRAGLHRVILPAQNKKDLRELPEEVSSEMEFVFVDRIEEVLVAAIPGFSSRTQRSTAIAAS